MSGRPRDEAECSGWGSSNLAAPNPAGSSAAATLIPFTSIPLPLSHEVGAPRSACHHTEYLFHQLKAPRWAEQSMQEGSIRGRFRKPLGALPSLQLSSPLWGCKCRSWGQEGRAREASRATYLSCRYSLPPPLAPSSSECWQSPFCKAPAEGASTCSMQLTRRIW